MCLCAAGQEPEIKHLAHQLRSGEVVARNRGAFDFDRYFGRVTPRQHQINFGTVLCAIEMGAVAHIGLRRFDQALARVAAPRATDCAPAADSPVNPDSGLSDEFFGAARAARSGFAEKLLTRAKKVSGVSQAGR